MDVTLIIERLGLVFVMAMLYGLARQKLHKPIGFGTFILVALGAAALSMIATLIPSDNPLTLLSAIVTGIGFLGAGALIRTSDKISGFTSAASIWLFAILGLVIGLGDYLIGFLLYIPPWIIIGIEMFLEYKSIGAYQKKIVITTTKIVSTEEFYHILAPYNFKMVGLEVHKPEQKMVVTFLIEGTKTEINQLPKALFSQPWFGSCKVE